MPCHLHTATKLSETDNVVLVIRMYVRVFRPKVSRVHVIGHRTLIETEAAWSATAIEYPPYEHLSAADSIGDSSLMKDCVECRSFGYFGYGRLDCTDRRSAPY